MFFDTSVRKTTFWYHRVTFRHGFDKWAFRHKKTNAILNVFAACIIKIFLETLLIV